jgi:hypothetical protein
MLLNDLMWLGVAAYGLHILEEYDLDWRNWARAVLGLPVDWADFYVVNSLVIVLGAIAAILIGTQPAIALSFPAVMLINGIVFHIVPFIRTRGRFSPGLISAVILFLPLGIACYYEAVRTHKADAGTVIISLVLGAVLMAIPVVLLLVRHKPYFRQEA